MGKNPFKNESKTKVVFYDITSIYKKQTGSKIVECYGTGTHRKQRKPNTFKQEIYVISPLWHIV